MKGKAEVAANYSDGTVVLRQELEDGTSATATMLPGNAVHIARLILRAAYALGYEEPKAESAGGGA